MAVSLAPQVGGRPAPQFCIQADRQPIPRCRIACPPRVKERGGVTGRRRRLHAEILDFVLPKINAWCVRKFAPGSRVSLRRREYGHHPRGAGLVSRTLPVPQHIPPHHNIRTERPDLRRLIEDGIARSRTLAAIVAALHPSDVVVYIESRIRMPSRVQGFLAHRVTTIGDRRGLRIIVSAALSGDQLLSVIAHELQHALEVAAVPTIRSDEALRAFFQAMSTRCHVGRCDTAQAILVQEVVSRELRDSRSIATTPAAVPCMRTPRHLPVEQRRSADVADRNREA
jgi:hypothetical protein